MGTHPIFESDFDCLTEMVGHKREGDELSQKNKKAKLQKDSSFEEESFNWTLPSDICKRYKDQWGRPDMDTSGDISFQQTDLDKYIDYSSGEPKAVIRMFGTDMNGSSIVCHVVNFKPFFFVRAPKGFTQDYCDQFAKTLNAKVIDQVKQGNQLKGLTTAVLSAEL